MILKRMHATFGRLDKAALELRAGLNVIAAPNEAGKSTWASFLLAMLYGVDTSERATRTNLPAKTRYRPWNGSPMEGSLELLWEGRPVTLERTGQGRTPMAQFRAYDTETGRALDALREDACGQTLLGVERSVYERSGFIRQQGMALSGDHALEARLNALVTTGDEAFSYSQVAQRLRDLRNRRRHNRTGLLPQAEAELERVRDALDAIARLGRDAMELQARRDALEDEEAELSRIHAALDAREAAEKRRRLDRAREDWEKKERFLEEKRKTVEGLPALESLQDLLRELEVLAETGRVLEEDLRLGVARPERPDCPPVFDGLTPDQVRQKAEEDGARLAALEARRPKPSVLWLAAGLLAAVAAVGLSFVHPLGVVAAAAAAVALTAVYAVSTARWGRTRRADAQAAAALLAQYGASDAAGLRRAANDYREAMLLWEQRTDAAAAQQAALDRRQTDFSMQRERLLARVRGFSPDCSDLAAARAAVQQAVHRQQFHAAAGREAAQARAQYEAVRDAVGPLPDAPSEVPALAGSHDPRQVSARLEAVRRELRDVRSRLDLQRGRREAVGDPAALAAKQEQLNDRIARLQREYDALTLAMEALDRANETLQTRFSPRLNELAARYMARMTGGRYDRVLLGQDMTVTARQAGDAVTHPLLALSAGTADQLYLAVRLAICSLALPPDAPLVLDDALVAFDDERMAAAMELLLELSKERQILLFTCQSREQAWLNAHDKEKHP